MRPIPFAIHFGLDLENLLELLSFKGEILLERSAPPMPCLHLSLMGTRIR